MAEQKMITFIPDEDCVCFTCGKTRKWINRPFPERSGWQECPLHEAALDLLAALEDILERASIDVDDGDLALEALSDVRIDARAAIKRAREG